MTTKCSWILGSDVTGRVILLARVILQGIAEYCLTRDMLSINEFFYIAYEKFMRYNNVF